MNPLAWKLKVFATRIAVSARILARAPVTYRNWVYFLFSRFASGTGIIEMRSGVTTVVTS